MSLFAHTGFQPLADQLRPQTLGDVLGQDHLTDHGKPIRVMYDTQNVKSFLLWGPPGCGKTTLAKVFSTLPGYHFEKISAIFSGVADLKKIFQRAKDSQTQGRQTLLFVDEIHRFNKSQQDSFLPFIEDGTIVVIGATTENPSFELNAALLSRMQVYTLNSLEECHLSELIEKVERVRGQKLPIDAKGKKMLCQFAHEDARALLNMAEFLFSYDAMISTQDLPKVLSQRAANYDKKGDGHYNLISALHKSMRGSDVNASLYWLARMQEGGEDPLYILRRCVRFASEDVGLADPQALPQSVAALQAFQLLGSPEGDLALHQCVAYLATAPKSNKVYMASKLARKAAQSTNTYSPPAAILNSPTRFMKEQGYGDGYIYDPDTPEGFSGQDYFPEKMQTQVFYTPKDIGFEREVTKRMAYWAHLKKRVKKNDR